MRQVSPSFFSSFTCYVCKHWTSLCTNRSRWEEKEFTVAMLLGSLSIFLVLSQKSHVTNNLIKYFFQFCSKHGIRNCDLAKNLLSSHSPFTFTTMKSIFQFVFLFGTREVSTPRAMLNSKVQDGWEIGFSFCKVGEIGF